MTKTKRKTEMVTEVLTFDEQEQNLLIDFLELFDRIYYEKLYMKKTKGVMVITITYPWFVDEEA